MPQTNNATQTKEAYINMGLLIIRKLNEGIEYGEVNNIVLQKGFPSSYVDGIIKIEHYMMSCKTNKCSDEEIIHALTARGWPEEIAKELIKGINKKLRH